MSPDSPTLPAREVDFGLAPPDEDAWAPEVDPDRPLVQPPPDEDAANRCPDCAATVKPNQRFCFQCGTPVATVCPRCHEPARPADKFCLGCGAPLRGSAMILR